MQHVSGDVCWKIEGVGKRDEWLKEGKRVERWWAQHSPTHLLNVPLDHVFTDAPPK